MEENIYVQGYNKYWMYVNGSITGYDLLQIGLPISVAILAGLSFNVILFFMVFLYCCSDDRYVSASISFKITYRVTKKSFIHKIESKLYRIKYKNMCIWKAKLY